MKYSLTRKALAGALLLGLMSAQTAFAAQVDLNLEKAVHMALTNNPTVKMSEADKQAALANRDAARASRWGTISFKHQTARGGVHYETVTDSVANNYSNSVTAALPIYTGGQLEAKIKQASKNYDISAYALEASNQQIKRDATTGYYTVLQASNSVTLAKEAVDRLEAHLKNTEAQFNVGVVAKIDVLRSQVELANAQQTLIKANNAYDLAIASLNNVIGLPLHTDLAVSEGLEYKEYPNTLENCLTYAMTNRPEIHEAEASVEIAKQEQKIANSANLPQVNASATNGWGRNNDSWPGTSDNDWAVGVSVNMNVFDYGVTAGKVAAAKANKIKAEEYYRQVSDGVQLDVRSCYLNLREAEKRISTSYTAVAQAEEDYHIAQVRYQAGVGTNTDVMDASVALTQAKNNYVQALYDYNTSRAELERAMGVPVVANK